MPQADVDDGVLEIEAVCKGACNERKCHSGDGRSPGDKADPQLGVGHLKNKPALGHAIERERPKSQGNAADEISEFADGKKLRGRGVTDVLRTPAQYADTDSGHPLRSDLDRLGLGPVAASLGEQRFVATSHSPAHLRLQDVAVGQGALQGRLHLHVAQLGDGGVQVL